MEAGSKGEKWRGWETAVPLPESALPSFLPVIWGCAGSGLHSLLHSETRASACAFFLSFSPGLPEVHCGEDVVSVFASWWRQGHFEGLAVVSSGKRKDRKENSRYHLELVIVQIGTLTPPCGPSRRILDSLCSLHVAK